MPVTPVLRSRTGRCPSRNNCGYADQADAHKADFVACTSYEADDVREAGVRSNAHDDGFTDRPTSSRVNGFHIRTVVLMRPDTSSD